MPERIEGEFITHSAAETRALGKRLGEALSAGDVITLNGDLGTGKTVLTKGIAEGLGIYEPVTSPTFTIVQEYHGGRLPLYHFDVYRVADESEMEEAGFDEYLFNGGGVSVIEWPELIPGILPAHRIDITIEKDLSADFDYRKITVKYL